MPIRATTTLSSNLSIMVKQKKRGCLMALMWVWAMVMASGAFNKSSFGLGCLDEERNALLMLKAALRFNSSAHKYEEYSNPLPSWQADRIDCCSWEQVICNNDINGNMRVTQLFLNWTREYVQQPLSFDITLFLPLKELQVLDLSDNSLAGLYSSSSTYNFEGLKLEVLDLSGNNFIDSSISVIWNMTSLKSLNLGSNSLKSLSEGLKLEVLDLSGNNFIDSSISIIWNMTSLRSLNLGSNSIKSLSEGICQLTNLEELDASRNYQLDLKGANGQTNPPCFGNMTSLRALHLGVTGTNGSLSASLFSGLCSLESLILPANYIQDFTGKLRLTKLMFLDLSSNLLREVPPLDELPSLWVANFNHNNQLKNMSGLKGAKLEILRLEYISPSSSSFSIVSRMAALKALSIARNGLNDSLLLTGFCEMTRLEELDISGNEFDGDIPPCLHNLTSLRILDLSHNHFGGSIPSTLFSKLVSLEFVTLSGNAFQGSFSLSPLANCTRLEAFDLVENLHPLNIETENPTVYSPSFPLKFLRLSDCIINKRVVPSFLLKQHELRMLDLSHSSLMGGFPAWLLENNTKIEFFYLRNNSFSGMLSLNSSLIRNADARLIDISSNHIEGLLPSFIGFLFPQLHVLNMSGNMMQGRIPSSMGNMKMLFCLDLSYNNFTGELLESLFKGLNYLTFLRLSNNSLKGWSSSLHLQRVNGGFDSSLTFMDVSSNSISGLIPNWIGNLRDLKVLLLSSNALKGPLPPSFCKLALTHLDLSDNKISPQLPECINTSRLEHLQLRRNNLSGHFPAFLYQASSLITLDLSGNHFSGALPAWIGSFTKLRVLVLKGNNFESSISSRLCQLQSISIMDLSYNTFSGLIPSCLNSLRFGSLEEESLFTGTQGIGLGQNYVYGVLNLHPYFDASESPMVSEYVQVDLQSKKRLEHYKGKTLMYLSGLDLSSNNLNGSIPPEIGYLANLYLVNLSNNHLTGAIPDTFSGLKKIESLDLSSNRLSGEIPIELTHLFMLAVFSVANNNLSGQIPEQKGQFATFDEKSYQGNPFLCGLPLEEACNTPEQPPPTPSPEEEDFFKTVFLWTFGGSSVVAFLSTVACLFLNSYYLNKVFYFVNKFVPCIY